MKFRRLRSIVDYFQSKELFLKNNSTILYLIKLLNSKFLADQSNMQWHRSQVQSVPRDKLDDFIFKAPIYPKNYDSYQIMKKLGEGSFAQVHLAYPKKYADKKVALKMVKVKIYYKQVNMHTFSCPTLKMTSGSVWLSKKLK